MCTNCNDEPEQPRRCTEPTCHCGGEDSVAQAESGAAPNGAAITQRFRLTGMSCADCAEHLERRLAKLPGVESVQVNFAAATMTITHHAVLEPIMKVVNAAGYGAAPADAPVAPAGFFRTNQRLLTTIASAVLLVLAWSLSLFRLPLSVTAPIYLAAVLVGGYWTFLRAWASAKALSADMNVLMTVAVIGASLIGEWKEAATVAVLYSVSNLLESFTMEKTRQSIRKLMDLTPREALVRRDGVEMRLPVDQVRVDDLVIVKPGEKIAVDGTVEIGASSANQAAITGESMPVEKGVGDTVYAGTLNELGALEVRVTKPADDTTLAKIIHLVEDAQAHRAPAQTFVDKFARYYTPAVLALAALLAILPPLFFGGAWHEWIYRALALVVIACPCALVISTPVAIVAAIGTAARHGVLIKGGASLEQAGRLSVIAFDKTGTLTRGRPEITDIVPLNGVDREALLAAAAAVESRASHPLAEAILRKAHEEGVTLPPAEHYAIIPGQGAQARIDGHVFHVGSPTLFVALNVDTRVADEQLAAFQDDGKTVMLVGVGRRLVGLLAAADQVRVESRPAIRALHHAGIRQVAMLTGDHQETARRIADELGIEEFTADLLPDQKVDAVKALLAKHGAVGMVGDGINDAPALATATLGIAMGSAGTDTALETADIALMADDLVKLPFTIRLSRKALRVIKQNIALALLIKLAAITLAFFGLLTLWLAVLADMGASILVTVNSLRLLRE
ncbi:MAG: heavy metal translocating P-type ATPase [Armatimonadota bacterium]